MATLFRSALTALALGSVASAFADAPSDFYCKKAPDESPFYVSDTVRACPAPVGSPVKPGESEGACVYKKVGCMLIDENVQAAAKKRYGKPFTQLTSAEKEHFVQMVTPFVWIKTDTVSIAHLQELTAKSQDSSLSADERKQARRALDKIMTTPQYSRVLELTDVNDKALADQLTHFKVPMFPSTLICRAPGGIKGAVNCPPPEQCKDDAFYNPVPANIAYADDTNTPDAPLPANGPGKVFRIPQTTGEAE